MDPTNMDVRLGTIDGRETEWTQIQRQHGNLPTLAKEEKVERDVPTQDELNHQELSGKNIDELDELEDEFDEELLSKYKQELVDKMMQKQSLQRFGRVRDISAVDWKNEVTNCKGPYIVIHLYATGNPQCDLMDQYCGQLSERHKEVKYLRILGTNAIKGFPEKNCPTLLVYKDGELFKQFGSMGSISVEKLEWEMAKAGICETKLKSDPMGKKKDQSLSKGWEKKKGHDSDEDY